ncbi:MAG: hypothetical protein AMXMBFR77_16130 [Phycisphaerales bacterium]
MREGRVEKPLGVAGEAAGGEDTLYERHRGSGIGPRRGPKRPPPEQSSLQGGGVHAG